MASQHIKHIKKGNKSANTENCAIDSSMSGAGRKTDTLKLMLISVSIFIILVSLIYTGIISEYNSELLIITGIYIIVALGLNLITGFTGQLALGQAGFMSIGAYTAAILVLDLQTPIVLAILAGGLVAAIFGIIIGLPVLVLKDDYLAIATLGLGEIIRVLMVNLQGLTGGATGLYGIPHFADTGNFLLNNIIAFAWIYGFAIITIALINNLINSATGRAIISVREDEVAATSVGINIYYYKVFSFTLAAFLAGIGGALYAIYLGYINPAMFNFLMSANFVVIVVLGGMGSITGTVLASGIFIYLQEWLRIFKDFRLVIFGLTLVLVMIFLPQGILAKREISVVGLFNKLKEKLNKRLSGRKKLGSEVITEEIIEKEDDDKNDNNIN